MESMDKFIGKWEVTSTENMDQLLDGIDMDDDKKAMYADLKTILEYQREGDKWHCCVHLPGGAKHEYKFEPGVAFDTTTLDGRPIKSKINVEAGRFTETHHDKADPSLDAKITKEVINNELVVTAELKGITSISRHVKMIP